STFEDKGSREQPKLTAPLPPSVLRAMSARIGQSLPVGNEGAGTVVAAGSSQQAQALLGKKVGFIGGASYAEYRVLHVAQVLPLPEGISAEQGAAWYVNPMTVLTMIETMRSEGHRAIVHTAAASNLGQMLHKVCSKDGIPLINIVRKPEHVVLLRELGATYVLDSSTPDFMAQLIEAVASTSATLAFDAIGGGKLAGQILTAMEVAISRRATGYERYGSSVNKQVYIYGLLDSGPTVLPRTWGLTWSVGGWLLPVALQKAGAQVEPRLRARIESELTTTFASHFARKVSLREALSLEALRAYAQQATGAKFLITPHVP
ncbi:MAG TPA: hypothetical protein VI299_11400, partial [Polyangiales bacterium]